MRNKLLYLVLPFFMLSCNEWLNVEPEDEISEEKLFSTGTGFRHALNGVYFTMESRNLYGKHLTWGIVDALGQVYDYKKAPGVNEMEYGAAKYAWDYYEFKPVLSSIWTEAYNVVANCNNIIQQIEYADPVLYSASVMWCAFSPYSLFRWSVRPALTASARMNSTVRQVSYWPHIGCGMGASNTR